MKWILQSGAAVLLLWLLAPVCASAAAAPTVTSASPSHGPATIAAPVTITGTGFVAVSGVTFGTVSATAVSTLTTTTVTCTAPTHTAGAVDVVVTNGDAQTGTGTSAYTFDPVPAVTACDPSFGHATLGKAVTVTGTVRTNRDLGAGYVYALLLEEARVARR